MTESANPQKLLDLISAGWAAQALHAAVVLGLPERLDTTRAQPLAALAEASGCDATALHRLLDALVTLGVCVQPETGAFALTPLGAHLRAEHPQSLHAWTQWWGGELWPLWSDLAASVRTGQSARSRQTGTRGFAHLTQAADAGARFHRAMAELTTLVADRLTHTWDFSKARQVVDVGGGSGALLVTVLRAYPALTGVLFEQSHALEAAGATLKAAGLLARCSVVEGDFFKSVPPGADVYLLKSVLHDWPDEQAARILASCRDALRPDARLLVIERMLPGRLRPTARDRDLARSDLTMLLAHGAGERSGAQLRRLMTQAGLVVAPPRPLGLTLSVVAARRR